MLYRPLFACLLTALAAVAAFPAYAEDATENRITIPTATPERSVPVAEPVPESGFVCTPGFTLEKTDVGYKLSGKLETPTPGFGYDISDVEEMRDGMLAGILQLTGPGGAVVQVIDSIAISYDIQRDAELSRLTLTIEKQFNWGPSNITCSAIAPETAPE